MKTSELTGAALDWAVATSEGLDYWHPEIGPSQPEYSTDWAQGGPIIEREEIAVQCCYSDGQLDGWIADSKRLNEDDDMEQYGPTPLIAAMRCYVASQFGDEVDVPEALL